MHDTTIKNLKAGQTCWDDQVRGLHVRAFVNRKSFYLYFRTKLGTERKPKIGDYGVLNLAKAREIAREMLAIVATGKDPAIEREKQKQAPTVGDLWDRYVLEHMPTKKPKSRANDEYTWAKYLAPKLTNMKVAELEYDHVYELHQKHKKTPVQANRTLALISKMLSLSERWKWRPVGSNPCQAVERYTEKKRKRYMAPEEAARISELLKREEVANPDSVAFIYFLILTGARKGEIAKAEWSWLDGRVLRLPDSKTGARPVYLPLQVMPVLNRLPRNRKTICGIADPKKLWEKIRAEAGCVDLRMHDLRHSFASAALKAGLTLDQIGELLGHASNQTTKRYAHLMEEVAHAGVAATAGVLEKMMAG